MIAAPVIGDAQRAALFSIESNTGFGREPADRFVGLAEAADAFRLGRLSDARRVVKPSPTSLLFEVESETAGPVMMRRTDPGGARVLAAQCAVAERIEPGLFIRPLATRDGGHVTFAGDAAWIAYPRKAGETYDGANCAPARLFDAVFAFEKAVAATADKLDPAQCDALLQVMHGAAEWPSFFERFARRGCRPRRPARGHRPGNAGLLRDNGPFLQDAAGRAALADRAAAISSTTTSTTPTCWWTRRRVVPRSRGHRLRAAGGLAGPRAVQAAAHRGSPDTSADEGAAVPALVARLSADDTRSATALRCSITARCGSCPRSG